MRAGCTVIIFSYFLLFFLAINLFEIGEKDDHEMATPNIQIWVKEKFPVSMLGNKTH
jgi:hypothetical protein